MGMMQLFSSYNAVLKMAYNAWGYDKRWIDWYLAVNQCEWLCGRRSFNYVSKSAICYSLSKQQAFLIFYTIKYFLKISFKFILVF